MSGDDMHDDSEFERFLAGEDELSRRLKALPQAEPSAGLDAAVLASIEGALAAETVQAVAPQSAANDAVGPTPGVARRLTRYWALPVGLAAGIVLTIAYRSHEEGRLGEATAQSAGKIVAQADAPAVVAPVAAPAPQANLPAPLMAEAAPPAKSAAQARKKEAEPVPEAGVSAPSPAVAPSPALATAPSVPAPAPSTMSRPAVRQELLRRSQDKSAAPEARRDAATATAATQEESGVQKAWTHNAESTAGESYKPADEPALAAAPAAKFAAAPQPQPQPVPAPLPAPAPVASSPVDARVVTARAAERVMAAPRVTSAAPASSPAPITEAPAKPASAVAIEGNTRAIEAAHADPVKWLAFIEQKLDAKDDTLALAEWDKFLKAHPAFPVKDELSDKIKAARERPNPPSPPNSERKP